MEFICLIVNQYVHSKLPILSYIKLFFKSQNKYYFYFFKIFRQIGDGRTKIKIVPVNGIKETKQPVRYKYCCHKCFIQANANDTISRGNEKQIMNDGPIRKDFIGNINVEIK